MKAGIFIDRRKALIIVPGKTSDKVTEIRSHIEEFHAWGGYGGARKDMPQDAQSDKKLEARKRKQTKQFIDEVIAALPRASRLYVFGPGETKTILATAIAKHPDLKELRIAVEPARWLTPAQMSARVREHFKVAFTRLPAENGSLPQLDVKHEFVRIAVSDATEIMVNERLQKLRKRYNWIIRARVYYKMEKDPHARNMVCEIELSVPGQNLFAKARAVELPQAIAETFEELRRQLRKKHALMKG